MPDFAKMKMQLLGDVAKTEHLLLQEIPVKTRSKLSKKTKLDIVRDTGIIVMAAKEGKAKRYKVNVPFKSKTKPGSIIVMGTNRQLDEFEKYAMR